MTRITDTKSKRRLPAKLAAGLAISAFLVLGTLVPSASAQVVYGGPYYSAPAYGGPYYSPPPVVYAAPYNSPYYAPYYAPPPVVYGPTIGIGLPFISIGGGGRRR